MLVGWAVLVAAFLSPAREPDLPHGLVPAGTGGRLSSSRGRSGRVVRARGETSAYDRGTTMKPEKPGRRADVVFTVLAAGVLFGLPALLLALP
jgi:hypothetical protein